jgi:hypothetical protein
VCIQLRGKEVGIGKWISDHAGELGLAVGLIPVFLGAIQYILIKRAEEKDRAFEAYHRLIKELVQGDGSGQDPVFLDRQVAVVYELRNFPDYYPVTLRILRRSRLQWGLDKLTSSPFSPHNLADEANLTIAYIKRKQNERSYLCIAEEDRL